MRWMTADLWKLYGDGMTVVVPTNVGWKRDGRGVLGRGLAADAVTHAAQYAHDWLPEFYGACCQLGQPRVYVRPLGMIFVPSKPLNAAMPHFSWRGRADWRTVEESLRWLVEHQKVFVVPVAVPLLGAGPGGLDRARVMALMDGIFGVGPGAWSVHWCAEAMRRGVMVDPTQVDVYMKKRYARLIQVDEEGDVVVGFPDLPGCMSHGADLIGAISSTEDARQLWLEVALEEGLAIAEPTDIVDLLSRCRPPKPKVGE